MAYCGLDCGTYNLIKAKRNKEGNIEYVKEVNAFVEMQIENRFLFNAMKKSGAKLIEREKVAYALGETACNLSYSMPNLELKRPMKDGCVNPRETNAFQILSVMLHSMIGEVEKDGEPLCYCVPANSINQETDVDYHQKILKTIFDKYEVNGKKVNAFHIGEGLAAVYGECFDKGMTAVGISFGSGQINFCFSNMAVPVFEFSIVNSGDWIDKQVAQVTGESITYVNKEKTKVDLLKPPTNLMERAIQTQYRIMIEKTMKLIKDNLVKAGSKVRTENPVDIILVGGTASPNGFREYVKETVDLLDYPIKIGEIIKPADNLYTVAKGCLLAAEMSV
jgi:actin-like ATPase involved in cell morphogenesis